MGGNHFSKSNCQAKIMEAIVSHFLPWKVSVSLTTRIIGGLRRMCTWAMGVGEELSGSMGLMKVCIWGRTFW